MAYEIGAAATGSAVQGGLGIIGSAINYAFNKRLAAQQNQYNIDMWKMQAEYDSPQAQMQRFQEAGLNPNLIYGQGSNGNMSSAPQMVTPEAPELSKHLQKLGEAFNIESLRTMVANRKKAQADADNAETNAHRNSLQLNAEINFGRKYAYDYKTGQYVLRPLNNDSLDLIAPSAYFMNRLLDSNYRNNNLIPYRAALMEHQTKYLAPQIEMAKYEQKYYPYSFWIGQGSKAAQGISNIVGAFYPKNWILPRSRSYSAPGGRVYRY